MQAHYFPARPPRSPVAHDGQVLPVPGGWDRDILERAAATLNEHAAGITPEPFAYWLSADWLRFPLGLAFLELGEHERAAGELRAGLEALPGDWRAASWTTVYADALDRAESGAADAGA